VLYAPTEGSLAFAEGLQKLLISSLDANNYRAASRIQSGIYLLNNIDCPAVLVECAFLSNAREEELLRTGTYRLKLAAVLAAGYLRDRGALGEIYENENGVLLH
jgi:N-acetylmuramoyl-L-alanine amidase